jgi:hypothetical protein
VAGEVKSEYHTQTDRSPDWRIVHNGRRYRVESRIKSVIDGKAVEWSPLLSTKFASPDSARLEPFETRFLWIARRKMRKLIAASRKPKIKWNVVEYAD